ncbi:hypothetical protein, partial [Pseudomonas protegens]|uniref:hypothetical protein n=1 Tax=Pseudomonas protegens TaxID=380021 RepID=UPI001B3209DA
NYSCLLSLVLLNGMWVVWHANRCCLMLGLFSWIGVKLVETIATAVAGQISQQERALLPIG